MKNLHIRRAVTIAAIGLVAAVLVAAALLSWTRVFGVGVAVLLALAIIILLDIRWGVGAGAELQRAAYREARDARSRAGALQVKLRGAGRQLGSVRERVERGGTPGSRQRGAEQPPGARLEDGLRGRRGRR